MPKKKGLAGIARAVASTKKVRTVFANNRYFKSEEEKHWEGPGYHEGLRRGKKKNKK